MDLLAEKTKLINNLKPVLIDGFVEYYGEEYRDKITRVIMDLVTIYVGENLTVEDLKEKMDAS